MIFATTIAFLLLQGVLGDSEVVTASRGNLRFLQDKLDSFTCAQQDACINLTVEPVLNHPCVPNRCSYKVCVEYKGGAGCPDFFERLGRRSENSFSDRNNEEVCLAFPPFFTVDIDECLRTSTGVFGPGVKRCVVAPEDRIVRFALDEGSKVCEPVGSQNFQKKVGSLSPQTEVTWTCGRNPGFVGTPLMDCDGDDANNLEECVWEITTPDEDTTPPSIPGLQPKTVQCANLVPAISNYAATDNMDPNPKETVINEVKSAETCLDRYTLTRTWEAQDACGLVTTLQEIITVADTTKPTFNAPPATSVTIACNAAYTIPVLTASDNCARTVTVVQPSSSFPCGTTVSLLWTATDECGNQQTFTQTVTVSAAPTPTPPTPTPPTPTPPTTGTVPAPGFVCFSGENTVNVQDKGTISMDSLEVGDFVQDGNSFSRVWSFMHLDVDSEVEYLQIHLDAVDLPLEITAEHFVLTKNHQTVRAGDVKVGDMLGDGLVTAIASVKRHGLYAPATESGNVMVSGVPASCYINLLDYVAPSVQASLMHAALAPLRFACKFDFTICKNEKHTEEGFSTNLNHLIGLGGVLANGNSVVQKLVIAIYLPVLLAFYALEMMFAHGTFSALLVGVVVIAKKSAAKKTEPK